MALIKGFIKFHFFKVYLSPNDYTLIIEGDYSLSLI